MSVRSEDAALQGPIPAPLEVHRDVVRAAWIDHNEHMNMGYYMVVFDFATDAWFDYLGLDRAHRLAHDITTFSLEGHITYDREVGRDDPLRFTTRLIDFDGSSFRLRHTHGLAYLARLVGGPGRQLHALDLSTEGDTPDPGAGPAVERARVNTTRAIRRTLDRIAEAQPELGRRLRRSIRTGTFCCYDPDPVDAIDWQL